MTRTTDALIAKALYAAVQTVLESALEIADEQIDAAVSGFEDDDWIARRTITAAVLAALLDRVGGGSRPHPTHPARAELVDPAAAAVDRRLREARR